MMDGCGVVVVARRKNDCNGPGPLEVEAASSGGYLASVVTEETGCGSHESPWLLRAPDGQRIQLRLLDFNATSREPRTQDDPQQKLICQVDLCDFERLMSCLARQQRRKRTVESVIALVQRQVRSAALLVFCCQMLPVDSKYMRYMRRSQNLRSVETLLLSRIFAARCYA